MEAVSLGRLAALRRALYLGEEEDGEGVVVGFERLRFDGDDLVE